MTLSELSQLYWLNREIEMYEKKLKALQGRAAFPASPDLSSIKIQGDGISRVERLAAEIVDLEAIIEAKQEQCIHERNRLERYIADIPDSFLRQVFQYRFVSGLTWRQVAFHIGGGNTADGVRKACMRYLEKEDKNV